MKSESQSLYTLPFWLLCLSNFLFSSSFSMVIPELPGYLTRLGGGDYIGLIIALFTLTAGISRPFSGKLTDSIGRVPVMAFGSLVCFVCGLLYPILSSVAGLLVLRLFHGFSTGFKPTATAAYVADITASDRRGEAIGTLGISASIGMSLGPPLGSYLAAWTSIDVLFYVSSAFALLSILILIRMPETLADRVPFRPSLLVLKRDEVFEPRVIAPSVVMLLVSYPTGLLLTIGPNLAQSVGLANKGLLFTTYTLSSLLVRVFLSKSSDRYGRVVVLKISVAVLAISMALMALSDSFWMLLSAAAVFGLAWGMNTPVIQAWTVDLSDPANRGKAVATSYIALEIGIGLGAYVSGLLYTTWPGSFALCFGLGAIVSAGALVYMTLRRSTALSY
jgi:MFS family permease